MVSLEEEEVFEDDNERVRLNVLQNRVENLGTVIIPSCLSQLERQKKNILRCQTDEEWEVMSQEQRTACKTIKQLRTHIVELEDVKDQVNDKDQGDLRRLVEPIQAQILEAIESFREIEKSTNQSEDEGFVLLPTSQSFAATANLWRELQEELVELHDLNQALTEHVKRQRENVDKISAEVDKSGARISNGLTDYVSWGTLQANMSPIGGAVIGGVVGTIVAGPLGFLVGANVGAVTTITGGAVGAAGGTYLGMKRGQSLQSAANQLEDINNHQKAH